MWDEDIEIMDLGEGMRNTGRDWITDTVFGILLYTFANFRFLRISVEQFK